MKITGWVLGKESPARAIQVLHGSTLLRSAPVNVPRPRVVGKYPEVSTPNCGFSTLVSLFGLPAMFQLQLRAIFEDGSRARLAVIQGRREPLRTDYQPKLWPLMVTSLGRTGTTWLMRLLAEHPQIIAHRNYPYELRVAKYWVHMLHVLSKPADPEHSSGPHTFHENQWFVGHNPYFSTTTLDNPALDWLGREYPERLASFCRRSTDEFYNELAKFQNKQNVLYFVEKHLPDHVPPIMREVHPAAREVFLVRDLRDMVSSILAFNEKRGIAAFGQERAESDEKFVGQLRHGALRLLESWRERSMQAHLIRYEDLIRCPSEALQGLLHYLGLDSTTAVMNEMVERAMKDSPELQRHRTSTSQEDSIGRWRRDLSADLKLKCNDAFADILREFGYQCSRTGDKELTQA